MANFEQRDNSGSLFINKRKETERHPDRQGQAMVDGKMYWVAGWVKKTRDGDPWMSLSFTLKENEDKPKSGRPAQGFDDVDDDIPF